MLAERGAGLGEKGSWGPGETSQGPKGVRENIYYLSTYYVPSPALGAEDPTENEVDHGPAILELTREGTDKKMHR